MRLMYILGFVLLIACIFIRIPIAICFYQSGNSTAVVKTDTDTVSSIFVTASFLVSVIAMALTYNSLKITQKTLKLTEIEQQKRDIEQRLELFYYPMSYYFKISTGHETKEGMKDEDRRGRVRTYSYRFRADEKTREQFEKWYTAISSTDATNKAEIAETLKNYINEDIERYEKLIQKHDEEVKALTNNKENEALMIKEPWYKFW